MLEITSERFRGIVYVASDKCSRNWKKLKLFSEESRKNFTNNILTHTSLQFLHAEP